MNCPACNAPMDLRGFGTKDVHWVCPVDGTEDWSPTIPPNGDHNPAREGDCKKLCGAPGCASWGCLN